MRINWTALAVLVGAAGVSAAIVLPERARLESLHVVQHICWYTDIQSQARELARSTMRERFKSWMKLDDPRWTDDELDKITAIELRDFYLVKADPESSHAQCGATVDFSVSKPQGAHLRSTGNVLEFDVHAASPTTWAVTMSSSSALRAAVESLKPEVEYKPTR